MSKPAAEEQEVFGERPAADIDNAEDEDDARSINSAASGASSWHSSDHEKDDETDEMRQDDEGTEHDMSSAIGGAGQEPTNSDLTETVGGDTQSLEEEDVDDFDEDDDEECDEGHDVATAAVAGPVSGMAHPRMVRSQSGARLVPLPRLNLRNIGVSRSPRRDRTPLPVPPHSPAGCGGSATPRSPVAGASTPRSISHITPRSARTGVGSPTRISSPSRLAALGAPALATQTVGSATDHTHATPAQHQGRPTDLHAWKARHVISWLEEVVELVQHVPAFHEASIDGLVLWELSDEDLQELGVSNKFHRRKVLLARDHAIHGPIVLASTPGSTQLPAVPSSGQITHIPQTRIHSKDITFGDDPVNPTAAPTEINSDLLIGQDNAMQVAVLPRESVSPSPLHPATSHTPVGFPGTVPTRARSFSVGVPAVLKAPRPGGREPNRTRSSTVTAATTLRDSSPSLRASPSPRGTSASPTRSHTPRKLHHPDDVATAGTVLLEGPEETPLPVRSQLSPLQEECVTLTGEVLSPKSKKPFLKAGTRSRAHSMAPPRMASPRSSGARKRASSVTISQSEKPQDHREPAEPKGVHEVLEVPQDTTHKPRQDAPNRQNSDGEATTPDLLVQWAHERLTPRQGTPRSERHGSAPPTPRTPRTPRTGCWMKESSVPGAASLAKAARLQSELDAAPSWGEAMVLTHPTDTEGLVTSAPVVCLSSVSRAVAVDDEEDTHSPAESGRADVQATLWGNTERNQVESARAMVESMPPGPAREAAQQKFLLLEARLRGILSSISTDAH